LTLKKPLAPLQPKSESLSAIAAVIVHRFFYQVIPLFSNIRKDQANAAAKYIVEVRAFPLHLINASFEN